jgi:RNA polymerase sigma-70 factor (ECF subfamily)
MMSAIAEVGHNFPSSRSATVKGKPVPMDAPSAHATLMAIEDAELSILLQAVVQRDEAALGRLYDLTVNRVYSLAYALTGNRADAEEIVGDVYFQVWQRAEQYDPARGAVTAWLLIQCRSLTLDLLRRRRSQSLKIVRLAALGDEAAAGDPVGDLLALVQDGSAVQRALAELSERQRRLIALAFFDDLSHQEIAEAVNLPLGTVKSHIRRGLQVLRNYLDL